MAYPFLLLDLLVSLQSLHLYELLIQGINHSLVSHRTMVIMMVDGFGKRFIVLYAVLKDG